MDKPLWGLRVLKFDGAIAPRVLKFDSGSAAEGCGGRKPHWGLRVDGPLGRRFLRGLSLTRLWREGCGGAYELIEGASLYKTFTTELRPWKKHTTALAPYGA